MKDPKDIGPVYVYTLDLRSDAPLFERTWTQEIEEPFRHGRAVLLRVPGTSKGVVVGRWVARAADEEHALDYALGSDTRRVSAGFSASEIGEWA